jgi:predicted RNA-binding protein YlqC (UPF0109 family)
MNEVPSTANGQSTETMKQLIFEIVQALVDQPDAVSVELIDDREATILRVRVAPQDIGKVIGKQGRTARSLRTILGAASMKLHHRFSLDILEDEDDEDDLEDDQQPQTS